MRAKSIWPYVSAPAPRFLLRLSVLSALFKQYLVGNEKCFLEIGAGRGDVANFLMKHSVIKSGTVIDYSENAIQMISDRIGVDEAFQAYCVDFFQFKSDKLFDFIMAFEVLEHVENDQPFLDRLYELTASSGLLFLSVPAYKKKWEKRDDYAGHVRRYERDELEQKLSAAGFKLLQLIDYGFPLNVLLRPIRERFYQPDMATSMKKRTQLSGTERPIFSNRSVWPYLFAMYPFMLLQKLFYETELGDGLIAVSKKC